MPKQIGLELDAKIVPVETLVLSLRGRITGTLLNQIGRGPLPAFQPLSLDLDCASIQGESILEQILAGLLRQICKWTQSVFDVVDGALRDVIAALERKKIGRAHV